VCIKEPKSACPENFVHDPTGVFCVEACGDGKLFELECDDGNLENGDGCDYTCQVEDNFTCFNNKTDEPTICSYSGEIIFELIYAEKDPFGNIIKMEYRIFPQLKFFEMFPDFSSTLKIAESAIKT
jgi:cysteine-rich repeat protein